MIPKPVRGAGRWNRCPFRMLQICWLLPGPALAHIRCWSIIFFSSLAQGHPAAEAKAICGWVFNSSGSPRHLKQTARHRSVAPRSQCCAQGLWALLYSIQGPRPKRWTGVWWTKCQMRMPIQRSRHSSILVVSMISFCRAAGIHQFTM